MAARKKTTSLSFSTLPIAGRIGVAVVMSLLVVAVYYVIFYTDVSKKIESAQNQSTDLENELATQQQALTSYFSDRDELALREQRAPELNKVLPAEAQAAEFLSSIQQVANVSGVDLNGWHPQEERIETYFAKVPMEIELDGHFHQIAKFAYEVGRVERIINMEDIQISEPHLEGDEVVLKVKCMATTFHLKAPGAQPQIGPDGQPIPQQPEAAGQSPEGGG